MTLVFGWTSQLEEATVLVAGVVADFRERLRQIRDSALWRVEGTAREIRKKIERNAFMKEPTPWERVTDEDGEEAILEALEEFAEYAARAELRPDLEEAEERFAVNDSVLEEMAVQTMKRLDRLVELAFQCREFFAPLYKQETQRAGAAADSPALLLAATEACSRMCTRLQEDLLPVLDEPTLEQAKEWVEAWSAANEDQPTEADGLVKAMASLQLKKDSELNVKDLAERRQRLMLAKGIERVLRSGAFRLKTVEAFRCDLLNLPRPALRMSSPRRKRQQEVQQQQKAKAGQEPSTSTKAVSGAAEEEEEEEGSKYPYPPRFAPLQPPKPRPEASPKRRRGSPGGVEEQLKEGDEGSSSSSSAEPGNSSPSASAPAEDQIGDGITARSSEPAGGAGGREAVELGGTITGSSSAAPSAPSAAARKRPPVPSLALPAPGQEEEEEDHGPFGYDWSASKQISQQLNSAHTDSTRDPGVNAGSHWEELEREYNASTPRRTGKFVDGEYVPVRPSSATRRLPPLAGAPHERPSSRGGRGAGGPGGGYPIMGGYPSRPQNGTGRGRPPRPPGGSPSASP